MLRNIIGVVGNFIGVASNIIGVGSNIIGVLRNIIGVARVIISNIIPDSIQCNYNNILNYICLLDDPLPMPLMCAFQPYLWQVTFRNKVRHVL